MFYFKFSFVILSIYSSFVLGNTNQNANLANLNEEQTGSINWFRGGMGFGGGGSFGGGRGFGGPGGFGGGRGFGGPGGFGGGRGFGGGPGMGFGRGPGMGFGRGPGMGFGGMPPGGGYGGYPGTVYGQPGGGYGQPGFSGMPYATVAPPQTQAPQDIPPQDTPPPEQPPMPGPQVLRTVSPPPTAPNDGIVRLPPLTPKTRTELIMTLNQALKNPDFNDDFKLLMKSKAGLSLLDLMLDSEDNAQYIIKILKTGKFQSVTYQTVPLTGPIGDIMQMVK